MKLPTRDELLALEMPFQVTAISRWIDDAGIEQFRPLYYRFATAADAEAFSRAIGAEVE